MVCHPGKLQQITTQRRTARASGVEMTTVGTGIELSCLSTINRSVSVMRRNKSALPPVSVWGQEALGKKQHTHTKKKTVSQPLEALKESAHIL